MISLCVSVRDKPEFLKNFGSPWDAPLDFFFVRAFDCTYLCDTLIFTKCPPSSPAWCLIWWLLTELSVWTASFSTLCQWGIFLESMVAFEICIRRSPHQGLLPVGCVAHPLFQIMGSGNWMQNSSDHLFQRWRFIVYISSQLVLWLQEGDVLWMSSSFPLD